MLISFCQLLAQQSTKSGINLVDQQTSARGIENGLIFDFKTNVMLGLNVDF